MNHRLALIVALILLATMAQPAFAQIYIFERGSQRMSVTSPTGTSARLTWRAPCVTIVDAAGGGGITIVYDVTEYILVHSTSPITESTFGSATSVPTDPPGSYDSPESLDVTDLFTPGRQYFALKAKYNNEHSAILESGSVDITGDAEKPETVQLGGSSIDSVTDTSLRIVWQTVNDRGPAGMMEYEVRVGTQGPLTTETEWARAEIVRTVLAPPSTTPVLLRETVERLRPEAIYYIGVRGRDFGQNLGLPNPFSPAVRTAAAPPHEPKPDEAPCAASRTGAATGPLLIAMLVAAATAARRHSFFMNCAR